MAKRKAKIVEPASSGTIQKWAAEYTLENVDELFSDISRRVTEAVMADFANFMWKDRDHDIMILPSEKTPGVIVSYFGGTGSNVSPHVLETTETLDQIVKEIIVNAETSDYVEGWRDAFKAAADKLTAAIDDNDRASIT